jgi:hypothetical protein
VKMTVLPDARRDQFSLCFSGKDGVCLFRTSQNARESVASRPTEILTDDGKDEWNSVESSSRDGLKVIFLNAVVKSRHFEIRRRLTSRKRPNLGKGDDVMRVPPILSLRNASFALLAGALGCLVLGTRAAVANVGDFFASDQEYSNFQGGAFTTTSENLGDVGTPESIFEYRYAMQFDPSSLPAGATITDAELGLRDSDGNGANSFILSDFAGNGTFTNSTITSVTDLMTITPADANFDLYDVTSFVQGLTSGQEAGFSLRETSSSEFVTFNSSQADFPPELEITYSVPEPNAMALIGVPIACGLLYRNRRKAALA